jgi:hypothetical protein
MLGRIKSSHRELECSLPTKAGALMFEPALSLRTNTRRRRDEPASQPRYQSPAGAGSVAPGRRSKHTSDAAAKFAGALAGHFAQLLAGVAQDRGDAVFGFARRRRRSSVAGRHAGKPAGLVL